MDDYVIVQDPRNNIVLGVIENRQVPETIIEIHIERRMVEFLTKREWFLWYSFLLLW